MSRPFLFFLRSPSRWLERRLRNAVKADAYGFASAAIRVLPNEGELKLGRGKDDLFGNDVGSIVALRNARRDYVSELNGRICERRRSGLLREGDRHIWKCLLNQHSFDKERAGLVDKLSDGDLATDGRYVFPRIVSVGRSILAVRWKKHFGCTM